MEIAFKVVEDANFFFFFNRTIAAAGCLNLDTEERSTTVKVENRL